MAAERMSAAVETQNLGAGWALKIKSRASTLRVNSQDKLHRFLCGYKACGGDELRNNRSRKRGES